MTDQLNQSKVTLVRATHRLGPFMNGTDECYARWNHHGHCPGHKIALWLNGLGPDDAQFRSLKGVTNKQVRLNWITGYSHIEAAYL